MTVHLRPDQELQLQRLSDRMGRPADQLAQEAVDQLLEHDAWFSAQVAEGFAQLDRRESVGHEEIGARLNRLFQA